MTDHSALIERLEAGSKQTITRYCGDLDGAIVSHDLLAEAAAALRDLTEWRDFKTAPRDGSRFLAMGGGCEGVETCYWSEAVSVWNLESYTADDTDNEPDGYNRPTLWLPLPSAPNQAKEAGE